MEVFFNLAIYFSCIVIIFLKSRDNFCIQKERKKSLLKTMAELIDALNKELKMKRALLDEI
jgi:hypothetical protein